MNKLQFLQNESELYTGELRGTVASILINNMYDTDNESVEKTMLDLMQHGCVSGMISEMIYYRDTVAFFDKYSEFIEDMLMEYGMDEKLEKFLDLKWDESDDADYEKNWFAWFAFESVAYDLANEMECN